MTMKKVQAAVLAMALLTPASSALAASHHHKKHHNRTAGTAVGAAAGALIDHKHPLTGALLGGALGNAIQYQRSKH